jgi:hypothetical protein
MKNVEVLSSTANAAVVQLAERAFPSICIQGDTLASLALNSLTQALAIARRSQVPDDEVFELLTTGCTLAELFREYERVISGISIRRSYSDNTAESIYSLCAEAMTLLNQET